MITVSPQRMNFSAPAAPSAADDQLLVTRYLAGDDQAFTQLLARHQGRVFTTLYLIVKDRLLAEDLTQDTFLKALSLLRDGQYKEQGKFAQWVCRIAHNLAVDTARRSNRQVTFSLDAPLLFGEGKGKTYAAVKTDPTALTPEAAVIQQENHEHLRRLIQELPDAQRQVLLMRHYSEMSFQEIAEATGVPVGTALGRMRYALLNLRRRMLPTAATSSVSLLLAFLLTATGGVVSTNGALDAAFFTSSSSDSDDPNFYPGNANPVRLQRPA
jgi:RNA polymerase sigma factor (sigma-70 family)